MTSRLAVACVVVGLTTQGATFTIATLSSRPDMVSGGDALVEIRNGAYVPTGVVVALNDRDVTREFRADTARRSLVGLVKELRVGRNTIVATMGSRRAQLDVVNFPRIGPIVSGPHLEPYHCNTVESGLGPPLDDQCSAPTRVDYFYKSTEPPAPTTDPVTGRARGPGAPGVGFKPLAKPPWLRPGDLAITTTSEGKVVPYIVRVESGTINRAIYRIAMPDVGWNRRVIYSFGGGCGTNYRQGTNQATSALSDLALSRGYAYIISTQNVLAQHCNDHLSGEALMMIKEHFIEQYGLPVWTMGLGGSGGAIQQLLIAQNFPGLLDGLVPGQTFPDSTTVRPSVTDCRLLMNYFQKNPSRWTQEKQTAVEGYTPGTCDAWNRQYTDTIVADHAPGCGIPPELVYDAVKNPKGARCTTFDTNVASFGRDPATGFARRPLDNVGVQYGLKALNHQVITKADFIDLNANVGGYDNDGHVRTARTVADPEAVRLGYATGRVFTGAGLAALPILHIRPYVDPAGDIHSRERDFAVRARLRKSNGHFDNQVIWVFPSPPAPGAPIPAGRPNPQALAIDTMSQWLDTRTKPAAASDACWDSTGTRISEPATLDGQGRCNKEYPPHLTPRLVAGAPVADDVVKCQLKPIDAKDYNVSFTADELRDLRRIFPGGVCDYSKPGGHQRGPAGTYLILPLTVPAREFTKALALENTAETSANVSAGDLDADGDLDLVLAKGRHWPLRDRVLLNDGKGAFTASATCA